MFERLRAKMQTASRQPGQVIVLFALASIPLMGAVGLAIDGGNILAQRRAAQNGADAAALAGARDIARAQTGSIASDMLTQAQQNAGNTATLATIYTDNTNASVGINQATGVQATVTKAFPTYFITVVGFSTYTVSAVAQARVQLLTGFSGGAPFIVCADGLLNNQTGGTNFVPGGLLDYNGTIPSIRSQAIGVELYIHGPQVGNPGSNEHGDCAWPHGANYKGVTQEGVSGCAALPCWYPFKSGDVSGPTKVRVAGYPGCDEAVGDNSNGNCVLILPIAVPKNSTYDTCLGSDPASEMCIVTWGAFEVRDGNFINTVGECTNQNCHIGRVLGNVIVHGGTGGDWNVGQNGPTVVRLTG